VSGGDPKLLPASPAINVALGHAWEEELRLHPDPAGSEGGRHCETSPPCTQDKIGAKETKAEEIQEEQHVAGDLLQLGDLSQGDLRRNEITEEKSRQFAFVCKGIAPQAEVWKSGFLQLCLLRAWWRGGFSGV